MLSMEKPIGPSAWLAQMVEDVTLDLRVVSLSPTSAWNLLQIRKIINKQINIYKRKEKPRGVGKSELVVFIIGSSQRLVLEDELDQVRSTMTEQICRLTLEEFQFMARVIYSARVETRTKTNDVGLLRLTSTQQLVSC